MKNTKRAFTLVELIVVITILAILGTIAFISLQGYSADARNSKRTTDLSNIASSLNIKVTTGMSILALAGTNLNTISGALIGGNTVNDNNVYKGGKVNYIALGMKQADFLDPSDDEEYIGAATTLAGGVFELAATMEGDNDKEAKVTGTFNPRTATTVTLASSSSTGSTFVTLSASTDIGKFKVGDLTDLGSVRKISADGMGITLEANALLAQNTITLSADESKGLIAGEVNGALGTVEGTNNVVDLGTTVLPY